MWRLILQSFPGASEVENPHARAGDTGSILGPEDSTCCRATKPMHHPRACALEPGSHSHWIPSAWSPGSTTRSQHAAKKVPCYISVQLLSHVLLFVNPWTAARWLPCPSPTPGACSNSCPLNWWSHPTISSCRPLLLLPSVFPSIRVLSISSSHQVVKALELQLQLQSFQRIFTTEFL